MDKQERNTMINGIEVVKSLLTQAQNHLDDGNEAEAKESMTAAYKQLTGNLAELAEPAKGGTSTEHM